MNTLQQKLIIVVPCFNEEASLPYYFERMEILEPTLEQHVTDIEYVFVNDGSRDTTLNLLKEQYENNQRYHYVSFTRNFGKEAALLAGLSSALQHEATHIAVMDADLQDPPEMLVDMFKRMEATEADVVAACRSSRDGEPPIRSWFARRFYQLMNRFSDVDMKDGARDFRLMTRQVVAEIVAMPERCRFSKGLFMWPGYTTEWLEYHNVEREHGETHWSFWGLVRYAFEGIIAFSVAPLEFISLLGLLIFLLSIVFLLFIVIRAALFGDPVAGWPSLVCLITLLSGTQLLALGTLGLYVSRLYIEVKKRPVYVIAEES